MQYALLLVKHDPRNPPLFTPKIQLLIYPTEEDRFVAIRDGFEKSTEVIAFDIAKLEVIQQLSPFR